MKPSTPFGVDGKKRRNIIQVRLYITQTSHIAFCRGIFPSRKSLLNGQFNDYEPMWIRRG